LAGGHDMLSIYLKVEHIYSSSVFSSRHVEISHFALKAFFERLEIEIHPLQVDKLRQTNSPS
jgi:hypothetical protein